MVTVGQMIEELACEGLILDVAGSPSGLDRPVLWARHLDPTEPECQHLSDDLIVADLDSFAIRVDRWRSLIERSPAAVAVAPATGSNECNLSFVAVADEAGIPMLRLPAGISGPDFAEMACKVVAQMESRGLEARLEVSRRLDEALVEGAGIGDLLSCAAELIHGSVVLTNPAGRVIAAAGTKPHASTAEVCSSARQAEVTVGGWLWGTVHTEPGDDVPAALPEAVLDRLPTAITIAHARSSHSHAADEHVGTELIADLLAESIDASEVKHRFGLAGLPTGDEWAYFAAAVRLVPGRPERMALALRSRSINAVQAQFVYDFVVLAALGREMRPEELTQVILASLDRSDPQERGEDVPEIALSAPASDLEVVAKSLRQARATLALATELGGATTAVAHTRDYAVDRLIDRIRGDPELVRFRDDFLGPLLRYDEAHSSSLVRTLATYLETGMSKTRTASELALRRPSLYRRLERIEELVGPLENSDTRLRLDLALKADRQLAASAHDSTREAWWMDLGRYDTRSG